MVLNKTEQLARLLHESTRSLGEAINSFIEWDNLTEVTKERIRLQAQWLLDRCDIKVK